MKKFLLSIIFVFSLLALSGCSLSEVQIEKNSDESSVVKNGQEESSPNAPETATLGDKLFAQNLVMNGGSGTIYWSINQAEVFETAQDAGLQLADMYANEFIEGHSGDEGVTWDVEKETFTDNYVLVMLHITVENVDAVSRSYAEEPEKYDKYDFRVDAFGGCSYGPLMYFSKMGECSANPRAFHLEPGESTEIDAGYLVDLREIDLKDVTFSTADTPENGTIINLNLS